MERNRKNLKKIEGKERKEKVLVALSGGIDSAVAAVILKRAGFEVRGVFLKLSPQSLASEIRAKRVAKVLKIPLYVLDLSKEFKKKVIKDFLAGLKKGFTPNPCVVCNKEIKFGILLKIALKLNADYVATGHYARKIQNSKENIFKLLRAKDKEKDQSYFLWQLSQEQLKKVLFPIGELTRKEVENLAKKFKLPLMKTKKSVEICFVKTTINDFLKKNLKEKSGKIVGLQSKIIGRHNGLWFYTIGQRRGLFLPDGPWWVLDKNLKKNFLVVTKNEKDLLKKELKCKEVNWIFSKEPKLPLKVKAKIRYRSQLMRAIVTKDLESRTYRVKFIRPQKAVTPGQSIVFYEGNEVLGGGVIV